MPPKARKPKTPQDNNSNTLPQRGRKEKTAPESNAEENEEEHTSSAEAKKLLRRPIGFRESKSESITATADPPGGPQENIALYKVEPVWSDNEEVEKLKAGEESEDCEGSEDGEQEDEEAISGPPAKALKRPKKSKGPQEKQLKRDNKESTPKKTRKRKLPKKKEEKEEEDLKPEQTTPKKSRKRKAATQQGADEAQDVDGEQVPKPVKRKRKTKEEKEAEAMPLAARSTGLRMFIGAHVSGAKGVQNAVTNCVHIGGNAFALFLKSQRKWDNPPLQDEHRDGFRSNCVQHNYDATSHILPHGSYLVNLAQEDPTKAKQAYDSFLEDLHRCESLGIKLYNFHPGTTNNAPRPSAIARIASALNRAHKATKTVTPVLETMASSANVIGSTFADLAAIISQVEDKSRIGVCLDTCHLFAAGYDLRSPASFGKVMKELDETVGMKYVKALHINDSKAPFGSHRDLHANIGTGFLGLGAFWNVFNEKRFEGLPMVLETPIDRKVEGDGDGKEADVDGADGSDEDDEAEAKSKGKSKGKKKGPIKPPKEKTIEDKSIWAREIKLLESLIDMDREGEEFKRLEKELADQGAAERKKHQEAYDRKLAKEQKVKTKDIGSFFKGKGKGKGKTNGHKQDTVEDDGSPLSELSEMSDSSGR
ncbi:MAG: hypothetical protein Q9218_002327 [Villophora microphyllina]